VGKAARAVGLQVSRVSTEAVLPLEANESDRAIMREVAPYTMTSQQRLWSLLSAVRYLSAEQIPGAFVECGVWRGGSIMAMAKQLVQLGDTDREVWLYDTFAGMTAPTAADVEASSGQSAEHLMETTAVGDGNNVWAFASRADVERNLTLTGYPMDRFHLVEGDLLETIVREAPEQVALMRLDSDWYESTRASLEALFPRLSIGGVCILDDYGHWQGARQAVDEYFEEIGFTPLMHPIDFSGRIFLKTR
jgi:hypothetical protein